MTLLTLSFILACGDKDSADSAPPADADTDADSDTDSDSDADADSDADSDVEWANMDFEQRKSFMWTDFEPTMEGHFTTNFPDYWTELDCATCHGPDGEANGYTLAVSPLDPNNFPMPGDDPWVDFMYETVTPSAIEMFGYEPYDPNTGEGFGCYGCHAFPEG